ncbi:MAG: CDP-alcohol phosphatidyltransferase family protein [Isosphaeraceae bacterium]
MKVYLLLLDHAQSFFYSDDPGPGELDDPAADPPQSGILASLERRWTAFRKQFYEADDGVALRARRAWNWMHSLTRPDEGMLVRLRSARRIDLHHPASRGEGEVDAIWKTYLDSRCRSHQISLAYNAVLAVPAVAVLWALPGPNVLGFWFAYRTIHHWRIVRGIKRVRQSVIPTRYHPEPSLDLPVERDVDGKVRHQAVEGREHQLSQYVDWLGPDRRGGRFGSVLRFALPNSLSLLRIVLALVFPWARPQWRAGLVVAAGLSDLFDGRLSRALGGTSTVGQILDPVADKLFVGLVLITLMLEGTLSVPEIMLVGFRDLAVVAGTAWSVVRSGWGSVRHMPPSWLGKLATTGQLVFLLVLTMAREPANLLVLPVELAAATFSVLAGLDYLRRENPLATDS